MNVSRRGFLAAGLASGFALAGRDASAQTICEHEALVAHIGAAKSGDDYVAVFLDHDFNPRHVSILPGRGHGIAVDGSARRSVVFARRPGSHFNVFNLSDLASPPIKVNALNDRHFYGHGCFSSDGRILFATENNFNHGTGCIGCYDSVHGYRRVAELDSFGVGPHELILVPGTELLIVANGGIRTHPDSGREKLNINSMHPSVALINARTGELQGLHYLPDRLHQLSIRHLAYCDGSVWFACQYKGGGALPAELVGSIDIALSLGSFDGAVSRLGLRRVALPEALVSHTRGYISSVAATRQEIMFTSSKGGLAFTVDSSSGKVDEIATLVDCSGISPANSGFGKFGRPGVCTDSSETGFLVSSGTGRLMATSELGATEFTYPFQWDNHLCAVQSRLSPFEQAL